ncbi:MAG: hypothetical protein IPK85_09050 [Gemmatimonadetes bacterium]|nr:hypothetical protein [Gemmatimonadota bacterium]
MITPLQYVKNAGAPDALVRALAALLAVLAISPWLGAVKIGGVEIAAGVVPKWMGFLSAVLFLASFAPVLPHKKPPSEAQQEVNHRLAYLHLQLGENPLSLGSAFRAKNALDGNGAFRPAFAAFADVAIEPLITQASKDARLVQNVTGLRRILQQLPGDYRDVDPVEESLGRLLRQSAATLPMFVP